MNIINIFNFSSTMREEEAVAAGSSNLVFLLDWLETNSLSPPRKQTTFFSPYPHQATHR